MAMPVSPLAEYWHPRRKRGLVYCFLEICTMESKSAPADLRSIVAKLSKPSSIGKA